jgi:hypothetical protein
VFDTPHRILSDWGDWWVLMGGTCSTNRRNGKALVGKRAVA